VNSEGRGVPNGAQATESEPELAMVVKLWPLLPRPIRAGIIGMIEAVFESS
jgi:hypothetical protein